MIILSNRQKEREEGGGVKRISELRMVLWTFQKISVNRSCNVSDNLRLAGRRVLLKLENTQPGGSFKIRNEHPTPCIHITVFAIKFPMQNVISFVIYVANLCLSKLSKLFLTFNWKFVLFCLFPF